MKLPTWTKSLPKSVIITGVRFKITYNMRGGACFDCTNCIIKVGCNGTRDITMQSLLHEISEIIHVHLMHRFRSGSENGDLIFVMSHDDFQRHTYELHASLVNCKLLK